MALLHLSASSYSHHFVIQSSHELQHGRSCITMPAGPRASFTAPVDSVSVSTVTVPAAKPDQFKIKGYLDSAASQMVADYLTNQGQDAVVW